MKMLCAVTAAIGLLCLGGLAQAVTFTVPGTANLWLAGMPDGTDAGGGDVAPTYSPVQINGVILNPGGWLAFSNVTGLVDNAPGGTGFGPDGNSGEITSHHYGAQFGKSDVTAPIDSLIGVFLDDTIPSGSFPVALNFGSDTARDYLALSPEIRQVFFIGNGLTSQGSQQTICVPTTATRLFLGTMDGEEWSNNWGSFTLDVAAVPEPASIIALLGGLTGLVGLRRRKG